MSIYFNNATTGYPKADCAMQAFGAAIGQVPSDIRHSEKPEIERAREIVTEVLKLPTSDVFFVAEATLAINCVVQAWLKPGDHCVADNRSHNAITRTLYGMGGVEWSTADLYDANEHAHPQRLVEELRSNTRLVCLTHVSNVTGSIYDLADLIPRIHAAAPQAAILADSSQAAGTTDLSALPLADFAVFPGHKHLHSTPGAAVLMARRRLQPVVFGGTGTFSARMSLDEYETNFVEVGTPNLPAIMALAESLRHYTAHGADYQARLAGHTERLWNGLRDIRGVRPIGRPPGASRNGTIACVVPGRPEQEWVPYLRSQGIIVRGGLHCCPAAHAGTDYEEQGSLRISLSRYTTGDEVEQFLSRASEFADFMSTADA